ncbi:DoxX family protein [Thalassobacillus sp. CUG 92003]|uniref:DoxX family protein n=1 Tax=Thalassobacillus sp. CUG 92003 TaxID=2736641 RepID=UPI0015E6BF8F|nr:DoxX family protein [Thalassobacillus sp. CUG 92003]
MNTMKTIRCLVAFIFIVSGVMKLTSNDLINFFINLGIPYPVNLMYALAITEIVCGIFLLLNKYVRKTIILLMGIMIAAILLTKVPTLHTGLISAFFNARLDIAMITLLFILYHHTAHAK